MNILFFVLLIATLVVCFLWVKYQRLRTEKEIAALRKLAEIQLEEACRQSVREVKSLIGQNLHDEFCSSLAGIVNQLDLLSKQSNASEIKTRIQDLHLKANEIYHSVRTHSHSLYHSIEDAEYFEDNVHRILDLICPKDMYNVELDIDKGLTQRLHLVQRIEVLRILQEALTNIIKHAKSANEIYIFLYGDGNNVIFQIGDNGMGTGKFSEGVGLNSIKNRVKTLEGNLEIKYDEGFQLMITFPLEVSMRKSMYSVI